jgi:Zn-dependent protease with chaperone function
MKKEDFLKISFGLLIVVIGIILRLLPHPPNFTPIGGLALFSFVYLSKRSFLLPIIILLISDLLIGYYSLSLMVAVYASFLLCSFIGLFIKKKKKWSTILGGSILAAFLFFLITNFAVWFFTPWYSHSFQGLISCYVVALPFFRNTILGNVFYTGLFFGAYEIILALVKDRRFSRSLLPVFIRK